MIATRGFVRTPRSSRARLSHFPIDAEALRVGRLQNRLVLICVLFCRGYRIPCSGSSRFENTDTVPTDIKMVIGPLDCTLLRRLDRRRSKPHSYSLITGNEIALTLEAPFLA